MFIEQQAAHPPSLPEDLGGLPHRCLAINHESCCILLPLFILVTIPGLALMLQETLPHMFIQQAILAYRLGWYNKGQQKNSMST